jgi:uncharacterized protein Usg
MATYTYNYVSSSHYVRCVREAASQQAKEEEEEREIAKEEEREQLTVTDSKTGLMWQRGEPGRMNWERAKSYCQNLSLAGYTDWQLPDKETLQQMFAWRSYSRLALQLMFPGIHFSGYWSSTTYVDDASNAWYVNPTFGYVYDYDKGSNNYVRCVRASQQAKERAEEEGRLTVTDPKTGLMWQKGEPGRMNWERAKSYCQNLSLAGYTDWQLPDKETLQQMFAWKKGGHYSEAELRRMFPDIHPSGYWSSTTGVDNTSDAWGVNFYYGYVASGNKSGSYYVRCVRGSK